MFLTGRLNQAKCLLVPLCNVTQAYNLTSAAYDINLQPLERQYSTYACMLYTSYRNFDRLIASLYLMLPVVLWTTEESYIHYKETYPLSFTNRFVHGFHLYAKRVHMRICVCVFF